MNHILNFWESQSEKFQNSREVSWQDSYMQDIEYENLTKVIINHFPNREISRVLDAGCANGFVIKQLINENKIAEAVGIDFSNSMIKFANEEKLSNELIFRQADVRNIPYPDNHFDLTFTNRVIINLPNWNEQEDAIVQLLRVTKAGGVLVMQEAFWDGLKVINEHRELSGLIPLVQKDFNCYLRMNVVIKLLERLKVQFKLVDTSSIYYFGTRLIRELLTDEVEFECELNRVFKNLQINYPGITGIDANQNLPGIQKMILIFKPSLAAE